jgi:putative transposase
MSYSIDLRTRVLSFVESGGRISEAARRFKVGRLSIYKWIQLKAETNSLLDRPLNRSFRKIDPEILVQRIKDNPDMLLREHAEYFGVRVQSISMVLQKLKITRKKRLYSTKNEMKPNARYIWSA